VRMHFLSCLSLIISVYDSMYIRTIVRTPTAREAQPLQARQGLRQVRRDDYRPIGSSVASRAIGWSFTIKQSYLAKPLDPSTYLRGLSALHETWGISNVGNGYHPSSVLVYGGSATYHSSGSRPR